MIRRPPRSPLFPYTPLSRSRRFHLEIGRLVGSRRAREGDRNGQAEPGDSKRGLHRGPPVGQGIGTPIAYLFRRTSGRKVCPRSEEHTSELQSQSNLVCRLLL